MQQTGAEATITSEGMMLAKKSVQTANKVCYRSGFFKKNFGLHI